jgi:16S rRNA (uracil1498-N3)-methyltransferase
MQERNQGLLESAVGIPVMRSHRIYSEAAITADAEVDLSASAGKHVAQVLRLHVGDQIVLFDGSGAEFSAQLTAVGKSQSRAAVGAARWPNAESPLQITLWHGLCRGARMDTVVQKATELGVRQIQPVMTSRSVVKLDNSRALKRVEHWQNIAISAAEQSGRCLIPELLEPALFPDLLANIDWSGPKIIFDTDGDTGLSELGLGGEPIIVCTGPEGGFSPAELELAAAKGFRRVCLGKRVLRTETAPIVALSLLQYIVGDLDVANSRL